MSRQSGYRFENGESVLINKQTTNYTLTPDDNGGVIKITSGTAKTVTVPTLLPIGFNCVVIQGGTGVITVTASGTTIHNVSTQFNTGGQYAAVTLISDDADTFILSGVTA